MNHWLVKQEPSDFSWADFVAEKGSAWTGVRNFQARNFLRGMKRGDTALFYHSGEEKRIVGIARVAREHYPDPTADEGDWACVDLAPVQPLKKVVTLAAIKAEPKLQEMLLVRQSRLSVMPLSSAQHRQLLQMGETAS
ncbi:MAG: EVE domain-containing protein [Pedosphaera sp.]|nr:EVE domain-containing protein [Pedosphaera sp.]MSU42932.1 EVE domain-containing protein [Pedosphaera sp.]